MSAKYIFITGGVVSGLGKGLVTASVARLLKSMGYQVTLQKFDPYINVDPSEVTPNQHGEIFITDDGAEVDHNIGHYERYAGVRLTADSNVTTGGIYWTVLNKARRGDYHGETVQVIPHITGEIKNRIYKAARGDADFSVVEIGGTVGDIESGPFLEAIRQVSSEVGSENVVFIHVTMVPYISGSSELKTKPTQHSVKELLSLGIQPDILICRSGLDITPDMCKKIALFCNNRPEDVIPNKMDGAPYAMPARLAESGLAEAICHHLKLESKKPDLSDWEQMLDRLNSCTEHVRIGILGKYADKHEAMLSVTEAMRHAAIYENAVCDFEYIETDRLERDGTGVLEGLDGLVASGNTGDGGIDSFVAAAQYCREKDIPYLGIGSGLHGMVLDAARNICGIEKADSTEFGDCEPIVDCFIDRSSAVAPAVRKGLYPCRIEPGTGLYDIYKEGLVYERHNSQYEINPAYRTTLEKGGLVFSAVSPNNRQLEAAEYRDKKWFYGVQYCFQFSSRPEKPHPIASAFLQACLTK